MLYFRKNASGKLIEVTHDITRLSSKHQYFSRWDLTSMASASALADEATKLTGKLHLAADRGSNVSPRYDVIAALEVGDAVSYAFNGDYYPAGKIVRISEGKILQRRIETDKGEVYYRRGKSDVWKKKGGTWSLVRGHIDKRNPDF